MNIKNKKKKMKNKNTLSVCEKLSRNCLCSFFTELTLLFGKISKIESLEIG